MSYGVIRIRYGGVDSTKFVDKNELFNTLSVPSGAEVDFYINLEEYNKLQRAYSNVKADSQSMLDNYSRAFSRLQNMEVEYQKLSSKIVLLEDQLLRANNVNAE